MRPSDLEPAGFIVHSRGFADSFSIIEPSLIPLLKNTMKKLTTLIVLLCLAMTAFAQEKKENPDARPPVKPALLVIDMQNDFMQYMSDEQKTTLEMINWAISVARKNNIPVIRIYNFNESFGPRQGTEGFEFEKSLQVKEEDPKIIKNFPDGFAKTNLDETLKKLGCNTVFLCGLSATGCVLATYFGAYSFEYQPFMLKGAILSQDHRLTDSVEEITDAISLETFSFMAAHL
jgi:nicotinamidase-related amidase